MKHLRRTNGFLLSERELVINWDIQEEGIITLRTLHNYLGISEDRRTGFSLEFSVFP